MSGIPQLLQFADGNTRFCGNESAARSSNLGERNISKSFIQCAYTPESLLIYFFAFKYYASPTFKLDDLFIYIVHSIISESSSIEKHLQNSCQLNGFWTHRTHCTSYVVIKFLIEGWHFFVKTVSETYRDSCNNVCLRFIHIYLIHIKPLSRVCNPWNKCKYITVTLEE